MRRALIATALGACLLAASPAAGSFIAYRCGSNLCHISPDGSGRVQLTADGGYASPSLSRDGAGLAFVQRSRAFSSDASLRARVDLKVNPAEETVIRPDGGQVAVLSEQPEAYGALIAQLIAVRPDASGYTGAGQAVLNTGYDASSLLRDGTSASPHPCAAGSPGPSCNAHSICKLDSSGGCAANVADDPARDLYAPAGSPDGTLIAVVAAAYPAGAAHPRAGAGAIALYSAATGTLVRDLTVGPGDSRPAWSPDGTQIAFARAGTIYTISAAGPPGSERPLTGGDSPSWGGGPGQPAPAPVVQLIAAGNASTSGRGRFVLHTGRVAYCPAGGPPCQISMIGRTRRGGRPVPAGDAHFSLSQGRSVRLAFPLQVRASRTLGRQRELRVTVDISARAGAEPALRASLAVRLRAPARHRRR